MWDSGNVIEPRRKEKVIPQIMRGPPVEDMEGSTTQTGAEFLRQEGRIKGK
jgi:hypothetical protein